MLLKEISKIQINGKKICVHGLEDNIVKISTRPKVIYRFNAIPLKIPMIVFAEIENFILNLR